MENPSTGHYCAFSFPCRGQEHTMFVWVEGATGCGLSGGPTTATELQNRPGHSGVVVVRRGAMEALADEIDIALDEGPGKLASPGAVSVDLERKP